jgi:hypothetical protein
LDDGSVQNFICFSILCEVTSQINQAYCLMDWKMVLDLATTLKISNWPHLFSIFPSTNGGCRPLDF